jgi:TonB family protein
MAYYSTSGPDSSPQFSVAEQLTAPAEPEGAHEADLASLTAKLAVSSGTRISPELSADLALDIVLHEIAEQACLATGATGAAIVLHRNGEMVCRATSGSTSPQLGARMDAASGLSWECMHTRQVMRCDDTVSDPRADEEASRRLGVRSVMVLPILRVDGDDTRTIGIFEAFSSRPAAFGDRDQHTLEVLAVRVLKTMELSAASLAPPVQSAVPRESVPPSSDSDPVADPSAGLASVTVPHHREIRSLDLLTGALASVVVLTALWLGFRALQHLEPRVSNARATQSSATTRILEHAADGAGSSPTPLHSTPNATPASQTFSNVRSSETTVPVGGLLIYENGKEVFRMSPPPSGTTRPVSTVRSESDPTVPATATGVLIYRVEPEYPEAALQQQIQGTVVLDARIGPDGAVEDVKLIRGPALLADAAVAAVKQWRFKPNRTKADGTPMQATITLNFRLPGSEHAESSKKTN